jgi:probable rRNA maturation factor
VIHIESRLEPMPIAASLIEKAANATLALMKARGDLTIVLGDDALVRELNRQYLGHDAATDVLSFPAEETDPETGARYLGDVILSVPQAALQARVAGHPVEAEVQLLLVHGILHLLGHDHANATDKARMWAVQSKALRRLGLQDIVIRE